MLDQEFLSYCLGMTYTERCGFVPEQIARLIRLSGGDEALAKKWDVYPISIHSLDKDTVREAVEKARARLVEMQEPLIP